MPRCIPMMSSKLKALCFNKNALIIALLDLVSGHGATVSVCSISDASSSVFMKQISVWLKRYRSDAAIQVYSTVPKHTFST